MSKYNIAVVGANSLVGEAILDLLAERRFPYATVYALADEVSEDAELSVGNQSLDIESLANFDFSQVSIVFFTGSVAIAQQYVPQALAAGCRVIDTSGAFEQQANVPLVVPALNAQLIPKLAGLVATPSPMAVTLLLALQPLLAETELATLTIATYQAVSEQGRDGVDELARQTAHLLNARPLSNTLFSKQIAFNVLPQIDVLAENGYTKEELAISQGLQRVLGNPKLVVDVTAVQVPVFFGSAAVVNLTTESKLTRDQTVRLLQQASNLVVMDSQSGTTDYPTPVTETISSDKVYIGRLRESHAQANGLSFWVVADNVRVSLALTSVQIAEHWIQS